MIRKRLTSRRLARILGWTAAAITWGGALMVKALGAPLGDLQAAEPMPIEPSTTMTAPIATTVTSFPDEPDGGLVVIRGVARPNPEPVTVVRRVVVTQTVTAPGAPQQPRSSGS